MPPKSGICILLELPDANDCSSRVKDLPNGLIEIERRSRLYPTLEERWLRLGAPATSWDDKISTLWNWILTPSGLPRSQVALFYTLSCFQGKEKGRSIYPKGDARKQAEATCAGLWLQPLLEWEPTVTVVGIEIMSRSDVTPLPLALRAVEKAKKFAVAGERVLLIVGNRAAKHWLSYAENSTRWCGHFQHETEWTRARRQERWAANRRLQVVKVKRERKLTAKTALALLIERGICCDVNNAVGMAIPIKGFKTWGTLEEREQMLALCAPKVKKAKSVEVTA